MTSVLAVDWSGEAKGGGRGKNALAEAKDGRLVRLEDRITRDQVVQELISIRQDDEAAFVGLDLAFSVPPWYRTHERHASSVDLWRWLADADHADRLLRESPWPFWGRGGTASPDVPAQFRLTEQRVRSKGVQPKSVFQINNPGSVGTGSIRGMCALHALRQAGWSVWPFDDAGSHTLLEIYPRLLTGDVKKSDIKRRREYLDNYLAEHASAMNESQRQCAEDSEDAFDAAISAIKMSQFVADLTSLPPIEHQQLRDEGIIWWPGWRTAHGMPSE